MKITTSLAFLSITGASAAFTTRLNALARSKHAPLPMMGSDYLSDLSGTPPPPPPPPSSMVGSAYLSTLSSTPPSPPSPSSSTVTRRPIVGGNWKCNPASASDLQSLVRNFDGCAPYLDRCDVYVCPSNLHVALVKDSFIPGISVTPQNCNFGGCGAYTGEMSVDQMKDMGMDTVLIGHSERRGEFNLPTPPESNALMATKLQYILDQGLNCVFCIGEPLPIRERGIDAVLAECVSQLQDIVPILQSLEDKSRVVLAYEPVWAIGTGVTASPAQAQETHAAIRSWIGSAVDGATADGIRIQYGGSANAENAPELAACPDIDGFLVGGASLKPEIVDVIAAIAK